MYEYLTIYNIGNYVTHVKLMSEEQFGRSSVVIWKLFPPIGSAEFSYKCRFIE